MKSLFCSFYVWEILHSTVIKMSKQVNQLEKTIEDMRDKLKEHERKVMLFYCCRFQSFVVV